MDTHIIEAILSENEQIAYKLGRFVMEQKILHAAKTGQPIEINGRAWFIQSDIEHMRDMLSENEKNEKTKGSNTMRYEINDFIVENNVAEYEFCYGGLYDAEYSISLTLTGKRQDTLPDEIREVVTDEANALLRALDLSIRDVVLMAQMWVGVTDCCPEGNRYYIDVALFSEMEEQDEYGRIEIKQGDELYQIFHDYFMQELEAMLFIK